jgi:hypothetical protein
LILALLGLSAQAATLTVSPTLTGWQTSARHLAFPGASVQLFQGGDGLAWGIDFLAGRHLVSEPDLYRFDTQALRLAGLVGWSGGEGPLTAHLGAGPATAITLSRVRAGDRDQRGYRVEPALRARLALEGPLGERLAWSWHTGATARWGGLDWDAGLGLGVRW